MKPLRLSIQAFGPYADLQELNFSDLAGHDFFLIHGPTGAGKTSVLDAVSYALYGETSGGLREARDMRSHFADPAVETRITFEFQLGGKTYRVERIPEQSVPKTKGNGFKKQPYIANLWELTGKEAVPIATEKPTAVDAKIVELMGFKADQFRQVVLLPQGQFQDFLLAGSLERQGILQVLFQTTRYAKIADALGAQAQSLREEIRDLLSESSQLLAQAGAEDFTAVHSQLTALDERIEQLRGAQKVAGKALDAASAELQEGHRRSALAVERDEAAAKLGELKKEEPAIELMRGELEQARRADSVRPAEQRLKEAEVALADLRAEEGRLGTTLELRAQSLAETETMLGQAEGKESKREDLRRTIARLKELEPQLNQLEERREAMKTARRERMELESEIERQQKKLEDLQTALAPLQEKLLDAQLRAGRMEHLEYQLLVDRKQRKTREEVDKVFAEARTAEDLMRTADASRKESQEELDKAWQVLQVIQKRWNSGQAALLASALEPGTPCPVCGSPEHPHPAFSSGNLPSEVELKAAQDRVESAQQAFNRASDVANQKSQILEGLRIRFEALREALGDRADESLELIAAREMEHRQMLEEAQQAAQEIAPLQSKIAAHEVSRHAMEDTIAEVRTRAAEMQDIESAARGAVQILEASLLEDLRVPGMLSTQIDRANQNLAEMERELKEARQARDGAADLHRDAKARLEAHQKTVSDAEIQTGERLKEFGEALTEARFWDRRNFERACLSAEEQERLTKAIQEFGETLAAAEDRYQRAHEKAGNDPAPDLPSLRMKQERALQDVKAIGEDLGRALSDLETLKRIEAALETNRSRTETKERRFAILGRLARIARGEEGNKVSFERFVQGAILDEVLMSASQRLLRMSKQRYGLRRSAGNGDLRRASGLDLEVTDTHTGRPRAASTLSGGEGFQASLALALGLSDVVQRHAGGVRLDTVFVDEGFGSLDQEALDLALHTLDELKQGGRLVGIISHLEEIKQRVPARLEVVPGPRGSTAFFRCE